ncbi:[FeFe] hydrogenase H-cluster radical SAM maturase HydE [Fusobacterium sp.]|uniref:[FeFe] hydrogenase H-cluster radical SAM maturase HydE n=1 Tax=Fusobacterium sp. TaxID=68766 RepID=UPI0026374A7D|nr:[FeFe] hydrogenase H-cluster radical SAM maturase HydE [Fusobacterium sp.]
MIKDILEKENLSKEDLLKLIQIEDPQELQLLLDKAYEIKLKHIGNKVYYRGLIECSNICIKNCRYCGIRKGNENVERFMLTKDDILEISQWIYENGYGSLALQSGERNDSEFVNFIEETLVEIQKNSNNSLGITLSLGEQTLDTYKRWLKAGASRYLLRIETTNRELFKKIHPNDEFHTFERRIKALKDLRTAGYQVGTGVMIGLPGQTYEDLVNDIIFFKENDIDMIGMGPYIIHEETPLGQEAMGNILSDEKRFQLSLKMIALCRIYLKDINIAATTALHALDPLGREKGILAGANVIMPNATSKNIKPKYQLYRGKPNLNDDAIKGKLALEKNLKEIGEEVVYFKQGNSPHFYNRQK